MSVLMVMLFPSAKYRDSVPQELDKLSSGNSEDCASRESVNVPEPQVEWECVLEIIRHCLRSWFLV